MLTKSGMIKESRKLIEKFDIVMEESSYSYVQLQAALNYVYGQIVALHQLSLIDSDERRYLELTCQSKWHELCMYLENMKLEKVVE